VAGERNLAHTPTRGEKNEKEKREREKKNNNNKTEKERGGTWQFWAPLWRCVHQISSLFCFSFQLFLFSLSLLPFIFFSLLVQLPHLLNNINKNAIMINLKCHVNIIKLL
jgi:hypothetical protein